MSKLASGVMITALFPPNSRSDLPSLAPTLAATSLPIRVEPVAETNGIRWSSDIHFPTEASPFTRQEMPSGKLFSLRTLVINFWQATPQSGAFSLGFQMQTSPQIQARAVFQLQTATGKLKAEMIPTNPSGWYCSYMRCPGLSECIVSPWS